jgi:hypothetical protein
MDEGDYFANLTVLSNDADEPEIVVPCTLHVANRINLQLKAFLEGPYNGTGMNDGLTLPLNQPFNIAPWNYSGTESVASIPANVVDWVLLELRDAPDAASADAASVIGIKAAFILKNGSIVDIDGVSNPEFDVTVSQNLFVVIRHRNHLDIMTASSPVKTGGVYIYDFTTSAGQATGTDSQKDFGNGVFGMYSGDSNADGTVDETDKTSGWNPDAGKSGYYGTDFNLDGQTDNPDKNEILILNYGKNSGVPE